MKPPEKLLVLYDGECPICCRKVAFLQRRDRRRRIAYADIRAPGFDPAGTGVAFEVLEKKIHAVLPDGTVVSGMDAVRAAWQAIGLGWLAAPTGWPILKPLFDALYTWVAHNRLRIGRFFR